MEKATDSFEKGDEVPYGDVEGCFAKAGVIVEMHMSKNVPVKAQYFPDSPGTPPSKCDTQKTEEQVNVHEAEVDLVELLLLKVLTIDRKSVV